MWQNEHLNLNKLCESSCYVNLKEKTVKCLLLHSGQMVTDYMDVTLLIGPQKKVSHLKQCFAETK
jgi:hypothetical protein